MTIYVGNLSSDVTEADLRASFEAFGAVTSVSLIKDQYSGQSKGFGFVEMPSAFEAQAAIAGLHGKDLLGRTQGTATRVGPTPGSGHAERSAVAPPGSSHRYTPQGSGDPFSSIRQYRFRSHKGSVANFNFRGKIRKSTIGNSMAYRDQNSRKSKFTTEPDQRRLKLLTLIDFVKAHHVPSESPGDASRR